MVGVASRDSRLADAIRLAAVNAAEHPLIVIGGSVGAGKTTLAKVMRDRFGIPAWIERADRNPHLQGLYEDPERWAYPAHDVFLDHALARQRAAGRAGATAVVDRSPQESVVVFARMLSSMGYISPEQLAHLHERLDAGVSELVRPTLMIYLHAPVDELLLRIRARGYREERGLTGEYLVALAAEYERFAERWDLSPLVPVDTAAVDLRVPDSVERLLSGAGLNAASRGAPVR
jgi:deoxyadenosine/deoxycytidine kinase